LVGRGGGIAEDRTSLLMHWRKANSKSERGSAQETHTSGARGGTIQGLINKKREWEKEKRGKTAAPYRNRVLRAVEGLNPLIPRNVRKGLPSKKDATCQSRRRFTLRTKTPRRIAKSWEDKKGRILKGRDTERSVTTADKQMGGSL